jgi:hypothetical protein
LSIARKLTTVLEADTTLAGLLKQTAALRRLDQDFRRLVPAGLAAASRVQAAEGSELTIRADHGAAAAKLKLLAPNLLAQLQGRGWHFTAIRIRVQVRNRVGERVKMPKKQIDAAGRFHLAKFVEQMPEGGLKESVRRLLKT